MDSYLDKLPLAAEEKAKLKDLAAETPAALLSLAQANRKAFEDYFGANRTPEILDMLGDLVGHIERQVLKAPPTGFHELGAIVGNSSPKPKHSSYDLEKRNMLFEELQYWQSLDSSSDRVKQKITKLTKQLNDLFSKEY